MSTAGGLAKTAWLMGAFALAGVTDDGGLHDRSGRVPLPEVGTYPRGNEFNWTDNVQGIASDGRFWYLSANTNHERGTRSTSRLYRAARQSLRRDLGPWVWPLSHTGLTGCRHIGDIDHRAGTIYVAIDGCDDGHARVGMFRSETLAYQGMFELPGLSRAAGVAWNPEDERLYALNRKLDGLRAYDVRSTASGVRADFVREIPLLDHSGKSFRGRRNQGLKFSPRGRAYVVFDDDDFARGGVYGFEVGPGAAQLTLFVPIRHGCTGKFTCAKNGNVYLGDELEGLLIERISEGPYQGDLHLLMIDNDVGNDDVYFRHHAAPDPIRL